jgi:hypothetical protein
VLGEKDFGSTDETFFLAIVLLKLSLKMVCIIDFLRPANQMEKPQKKQIETKLKIEEKFVNNIYC